MGCFMPVTPCCLCQPLKKKTGLRSLESHPVFAVFAIEIDDVKGLYYQHVVIRGVVSGNYKGDSSRAARVPRTHRQHIKNSDLVSRKIV